MLNSNAVVGDCVSTASDRELATKSPVGNVETVKARATHTHTRTQALCFVLDTYSLDRMNKTQKSHT